MINFQIRYDESLARWQYQDRKGHWSRPMRLAKLQQALQAELCTFEEQPTATRTHPDTAPATYRRSPVRDLAEQVEYEIRAGKVVPRKLPQGKFAAQVAELSHLLGLD